MLARVYRDMEVALAAARKLWGEDVAEETLIRTAEAFLVHCRELRRNGGIRVPPSGERAGAEPPPTTTVPSVAVPSACPECGRRVIDQRTSKRNPRAPDVKCSQRECAWAIWKAGTEGVSCHHLVRWTSPALGYAAGGLRRAKPLAKFFRYHKLDLQYHESHQRRLSAHQAPIHHRGKAA